MKKYIVIVKCNWTGSEYIYPKRLTFDDAESLRNKLTDENNVAHIAKIED